MSKEKRRVPKLRFPGFTEDWEQRKLGNIVDFLDGQRKPLKESERTKGKYPYYGASGIIDYINDYLFDENLVLLSEDGANIIDRNYPVCFIATGKYWVNNHAHVLKVKTGVIDKFICESLERLDYTKFNTGTAQPKLNQDICQKIVITIPNEDEQKCISEFLDRINNIITLHQRKLDNLKLKKKALLQKLFPKNGERYPELRFPGFTDAWEQRKLGDYLIQYTEITTQNNQYPVLTSSRKGLFFQTDYYDGNQIASKDNTGYNIVPYGYFTYRHMSDDEIFHFNINYIVDKGIVSTLYPVFTTKNLNSNFLQLQLNYGNEFKEYAVLLKQGGSRTYMYFNKLKNLNLTISTSIDEQEIIAKFFILFEKLITLHQRKLDHLQLQKKALLQQMFV